MRKFTDRIDQRFPYTPASETAKPGYLKAKFDKVRREQREKEAAAKAEQEAVEAEQKRVVRKIGK